MKHILFITAVALILLSSCQRAVPGLSVQSASEKELSASGGTVKASVKSDGEWKTSTDADIIVKPSSGSGDQSVSITVPANTTAAGKEMEVAFYSVLGEVLEVVAITQNAPSVSAKYDGRTISPLGETIDVKVTSDGGWRTYAGEGVAVSPSYSFDNETDAKIVIPANTSGEERDLEVRFCSALNSSVCDIVKIHQKSVFFSVNPSRDTVPPTGGTRSFTVTADGEWRAITDNGSTVVPAVGTDVESVDVIVLANATGHNRDVKVVFYSTKSTSLSDTVTIHQEPLSIKVTPESTNVSAVGGDIGITVQANGPWTASAVNGSIVGSSTGDGDGSVIVRAYPNVTGSTRDVSVVFTLDSLLEARTDIKQEPIQIEVEQSDIYNIPAAGNTVSVTLHSNCSWKTQTGEWIYSDGSKNVSDQIVSDPSSGGPGDYNVSITVPANRSIEARNVTIKFYYEDKPAISDSVTIHQKSPSVSVSKDSIIVSSNGGEVKVNVKSDGGWKSSCDSESLTINPIDYAGSDGTEVKITVPKNEMMEYRYFYVTFHSLLNGAANKTVKITQNW